MTTITLALLALIYAVVAFVFALGVLLFIANQNERGRKQ